MPLNSLAVDLFDYLPDFGIRRSVAKQIAKQATEVPSDVENALIRAAQLLRIYHADDLIAYPDMQDALEWLRDFAAEEWDLDI